MDQEYKLSRIIIAILTVAASFIVLINEDISFKIVGITLFTLVSVLSSFAGTRVSKLMIKTGDRIKNVFLRIGYYFALFAVILVIAFLFWLLLEAFSDAGYQSKTLADALSRAIFTVLTGATVFIFLLIPFIQTSIVLILRKTKKGE